MRISGAAASAGKGNAGILVINIGHGKITGGILNRKSVGYRILRANGKTDIAVLRFKVNRRRRAVNCEG